VNTPEGKLRRRVRLNAPAKINLHLEVLRLRHDGYHDIETILQAIDLHDTLQVTLLESFEAGTAPEIELLVKPAGSVTDGDDNLCIQAALLFCREQGVSGHLQMELQKNIPVGAGLGGGSSDAMAVLIACDRLFKTNLDQKELEAMGAKIGSDVPFFAAGGTQLGRGRGTKLTPLPALRSGTIVLLKPHFSCDTGNTYGALKMGLTVRTPAANLQVIKSLIVKFFDRPWFGFNRLEEVVLPTYPELSRILLRLREEAPVAMLSGSGSAVFGILQRSEQADALIHEFSAQVKFARTVTPLPRGVQVLEG